MSAHLSDEDLQAAVALRAAHPTEVAAADASGLSRNAFRNRLKRATERGLAGFAPVMPGFEVKQVSSRTPDGAWVKQTREAGEVFEVPAGHEVGAVSALVDDENRVRLKWLKTRAVGKAESVIDAVRTAFAEYQGAAPLLPLPAVSDADLLTVYPLPDLHLGMHAWGREVGESYDLKIAADRAREMSSDLIAQSRPSREAVILGLGDFFHMNDQKNQTPASGHILDVDGRWPKVLKTGIRLAMDMIELAAQKHERVTVRFLPGNHDPDATAALTAALAIFYERNPRITVDDDPSLVFYHRFGRVLLGATHGHTMKPERMAMMLAEDRPVDWGECHHKAVFFGHIHHETAREVGTVRVESFNTIAGKDAYAHGGGYRSGKALNALTYHRHRGEIGRHRVNFLPPRLAHAA
ncbi:hypothetical protein PMNALOAF_2779 [Methylobacterium adhaesivum]|uniref:Oxidoreductase n=1 Tax=Methylobacterium adhaesivum TaxID=333297 RepID=A0ABT8BKV3_9HYPH|nr:hypothetical protein [Methylobacterium adhaesivum]MDN3592132.1 hypothetical protein [Methylobacterium adhaesivum]GJD31520.1 hypothetical protein PMNALOAF_2779 [Methylobacterium adhaesivum]